MDCHDFHTRKSRNDNGESYNISSQIIEILKTTPDWLQIETLKEMVKGNDFYQTIETLENEKVIEVFRTFDEKIKPKYVNG
jgi:hypothetical protein